METTVKNFTPPTLEVDEEIDIHLRTQHEMNSISKVCAYRECSEELIGYSAEFCCQEHGVIEQGLRKTALLTQD